MGAFVKQRCRRRKETEFVDSDFAEALYGNKSEDFPSNRQAQRKAQQFCRQVQRALNLALADSQFGREYRRFICRGRFSGT